MNKKDNAWTAPDTTAFKNIKPGDIPSSSYNYKGDNVGNSGNLPNSTYNHKGDNVGKSGNLPNKTGDKIANHKGDNVGKKASYKGPSQV